MEEVEANLLEGGIQWLAETILENLDADKLDEWIRQVGLVGDTGKLRPEIERVIGMLAAVKGRAIGNRPLARSLGRVRELLYDTDDVIDDIDYYRLQQQVQGDAWDGHHEAEQTERTAGRGNIGEASGSDVMSTQRSEVWRHFTVVERENGKTVKARCIDCNTVVKCGSSNGTSVLHNHRDSGKCKRKRGASDQPPNLGSASVGAANGNSAGRKTMRTEEASADQVAELSSGIQQMIHQLQEAMSEVLRLCGSNYFSSLSLHQNTTSDTPLRTSSLLQRKFYGRVEERNSIIKLMTEAKSDGATILPIVGIGGIGKTAIAQFIYNDPVVERLFQQRVWVWVSNNFDEVQLTREMLDFVCQENHERLCSFAKLQELLIGSMKTKRFLLVLDDVWEDMNNGRLNKLLAPLKSNDAKGNVILVTTRLWSVAKMIGTVKPIELGVLEKEDSWLLLKSSAFGDENHEPCASLSTIGHKIADKLKGNPLAVETAGELLSGKHTIYHWNDILKTEDWKSLQLSGGIMQSLKRSYDLLPYNLKQCLSYCSLFPKRHYFSKAQLLQIWIAQGFVEKSNETLEQKGWKYIIELMDSGFFQQVESEWFTSDDYFFMRDLMHDLARMVSRTEYATIDGSECRELVPTIRHLSIVNHSAYRKDQFGNISHNEDFEESLQKVMSRSKLRTLLLIGKYDPHFFKSLQDAYDPHFFKSFRDVFKEAQHLRLLQITATYPDLESFLSSLVNSTHLRYLRIESRDYREALPHPLCKCYHLQVLDVGSCGTPDVPVDINNLVCLQHLIAPKGVCSTIANIDKMSSLQELDNFVVQNLSGFEVTQLKSMEKLVRLGVSRLANVTTREEARGASLKDKQHLEKLHLSWKDAWNGFDYENEEGSGYENESDSDGSSESSVDVEHHIDMDTEIEGEVPMNSSDTNDALSLQHHIGMISAFSMDIETEERLPMGDANDAASSEHYSNICSQLSFSKVLDGLEPHHTLKHLRISGYNGARPPTWLSSSLTCLQTLCLESCGGWQKLTLQSLHSLRKLVLIKIGNAIELSIPSLEELVLIKLPRLKTCSCTSTRDLNSCLRVLKIKKCPELLPFFLQLNDDCQSLNSLKGLKSLSNLRLLKAYRCIGDHIEDGRCFLPQSLEEIYVYEYSLETLQPCFRSHLTCLKKIEVKGSASLKSLELQSCTALEELDIQDCPSLFALEGLQSLRRLRDIQVFQAASLTSLDLQSCIELEELSIRWCLSLSRLEGLPSVCSLKRLYLEGCPRLPPYLESLSVQGYELCPQLNRFTIDDPSILTTSFCKHLTSLQRLEFSKCGREVTRLTNEQEMAFQLLTSLQELLFWYCNNLIDLPTELHSLPFLKWLKICNCKIERLPEKGLPPSLEEMVIFSDSEELVQQCRTLASTSKLKININGRCV
uniref:BED-type domain-containing protein n=1 Tax=Leersia perrieri TaxID=77586 RepID=A0A0D9W9Q0_9ORYZ